MLPQKKYKLIIVPIIIISAFIWYQNSHKHKLEYLSFDELLETNQNDGILSEIMPRPNSFFLVETSGRIHLTSKELCVLESVAKYHPINQVYLLITSPIFQDDNFEVVKKKYGNLQAKYLHLPSLIHGSPIADLKWIEIIEDSKYR